MHVRLKGVGQLALPLESWFHATESSMAANRVPPHEQVMEAVVEAMEGHVQQACLAVCKAQGIATWADLQQYLLSNFASVDRAKAAAEQLESLKMKGFSLAALERYLFVLHAVYGQSLNRYRQLVAIKPLSNCDHQSTEAGLVL